MKKAEGPWSVVLGPWSGSEVGNSGSLPRGAITSIHSGNGVFERRGVRSVTPEPTILCRLSEQEGRRRDLSCAQAAMPGSDTLLSDVQIRHQRAVIATIGSSECADISLSRHFDSVE